MARYILLTPVQLGGKGKPLERACCFNLLSVSLPYRWQTVAPLRKLLLLFAEVVGIAAREALAIEGLLPRGRAPSLLAVVNAKGGEYVRLSAFLSSYRVLEGYARAKAPGVEVKHGPTYSIRREAYPYLKALLAAVDVYMDAYAHSLLPLSIAIMDRLTREIRSKEALERVRERLSTPSTKG